MPVLTTPLPSRRSQQAPPETDDSWRSLTPPPKMNATPKSPFEAQIFHRMVEHLQEEQVNQSAILSQAPSVQEMDDSVSLTDHDPVPDTTAVAAPATRDLTPLHEDDAKSLPLHVVETATTENEIESWDWSLQHPKLAPFPDVGSLLGTPEIRSASLMMATNVHTDDTTRFGVRLMSLESFGSVRSGRIHDGTLHYFCFAGRVRLWRLQADGTTIPSEIECNEHVCIPSFTPHMVEALEVNCVLAEWCFDSTIADSVTFQPYDDLERCTIASSVQRTTSIPRILKAVGKNELFWAGLAAGLSVGFLLGRRRGR